MESSYITALETRAQWLQWGVDTGQKMWGQAGRKYIPGIQSYLKCLQSGDTYFMNKKFCSLVDNARSTVPDDLQFESDWMLSPQGWMWIEEPFSIPTIEADLKELKDGDPLTKEDVDRIARIRISAIGWLPISEGFPTADYMNLNKEGRVAGKGAYQFLCFLDFNIFGDKYINTTEGRFRPRGLAEKGGFGTWSYFMLQDGDKLIDRIHQFEEKAAEEGGHYKEQRSRDMLHEIRWIYSAMYLMSQRLAITVHHDTDRATRRRGVREKREVKDYIKVISLRRYEEEKKHAERTGTHVDWQWQWTVRGHWRNQFYPSIGEYKPKFIESFIKGPSNKPLKPDSINVFVARR